MANYYTPIATNAGVTASTINAPLQQLDNVIAGLHYNVKAYGAIGDGVTDDRAAIQSALDACNSGGGGTVYLSPGTYLFSIRTDTVPYCGLILYSNVCLRGAGPGATILKVKDSQSEDLVNDGARLIVNSARAAFTDANIVIRDLTLDGNGANQDSDRMVGLDMSGVRHVWVENVIVKNVRGTTSGSDGPHGSAGEGFLFEFEFCTDVMVVNCVAYGDAGSTSSGFSTHWSNGVHYVNCIAYGMSVANGFTEYKSAQSQYTNCHSYQNELNEFNCEYGENVIYENCVAGGRNVNSATHYGDQASIGGAEQGFTIAQTTYFQVRNCSASYEDYGLGVDSGCSYGVIEGQFCNNTNQGITVHATAVPTVRVGEVYCYGNGVAEFSDSVSISSAIDGGWTTAPSIPASTTPLTNPYPWHCAVTVSGGTVTAITVAGTATGLTSGTVVVRGGQTIALTYSVAPTWVWMKV